MKIQVVGSGCAKCKATYQNVIRALAELNLKADVEYITDIREFVKLGVFTTPLVLINGKLVFSGKVPNTGELKEIIKQMAN